jgi:trigger factor
MKVTQEKLPDSRIGLEIEIPGETSQTTYNNVVKNLARTANIPGFRKGKVPRQVLLQRLGSSYIKAATLEELLQTSIKTAISQEKIESLGSPSLRSNFEELVQVFIPGIPLTVSITVDVPPTVTLGEIESISVQAEENPYDPQQVEDWLQERREAQATLIPVEDRSAALGDVVIVDYQAYRLLETGERGEAIADIHGTDFKVELEEGRFVTGIVEGILGMALDENKDVEASFPADYPLEAVAGETVIFNVTLKEIKTKELPELDDDFADEVSDYETLAELRDALEKRYQEEAADKTKANIHDAILKELVKVCPVDLPDTLIQEETGRVLTQTAMQMEQMGLDVRHLFTEEMIPQLRANARPEAIERLQQSLILLEIAKVHQLQPEPATLQTRINEVRAQFRGQAIDETKLQTVVTEELTQAQVLDWLREKVTVELVPLGTLTAVEVEAGDTTLEAEVTETADAALATEAV